MALPAIDLIHALNDAPEVLKNVENPSAPLVTIRAARPAKMPSLIALCPQWFTLFFISSLDGPFTTIVILEFMYLHFKAWPMH